MTTELVKDLREWAERISEMDELYSQILENIGSDESIDPDRGVHANLAGRAANVIEQNTAVLDRIKSIVDVLWCESVWCGGKSPTKHDDGKCFFCSIESIVRDIDP